jgi:phospholipase/carboxylesterase
MTLLRSVLSTTSLDADADSTAPVVLLLHGFGSNEHDLPSLSSWIPRDVAWASLRAPIEMEGGAAAWFWHPVPGEEPEQASIDIATAAIWEWVDAHVPTGAPIVPLGFSQGGMMALELLRSRPERIAAAVVLGGFVGPGERDADAGLAESRPPVFWGRGEADDVVEASLVKKTASWIDAHADATVRVYPALGHSIAEEEMDDVHLFLVANL